MNKLLLLLATTFLLSACVTDPDSPFYTGTEPVDAVVADGATDVVVETVDAPIEEITDEIDATEDSEEVVVASASQCLTSDVLANVTYTVIPKGTKGTVETSGGTEYFVTGGARHDVTNVPYNLTSC